MTPPRSAAPQAETDYGRSVTGWRLRVYTVIFEADTRAGRAFDLALIALILLSVAVLMLDRIAAVHVRHAALFTVLAWIFTLLFPAE